MTALDLGAATRTLTPPTSEFSSVAYGDVNLGPTSGTHLVSTWSGNPSILMSAAGASHIYTDAPISVPQNTATFVAFADVDLTADSWNVLWHHSGMDLGISATEVEYAAFGNANYTPGTHTLTTSLPTTGIVVFAIVSNSTEGRILNSLDGTIYVDATSQAATASDTFQIYTALVDGHLLGVWQYDGVTVSETDAIDTMAAIEASLSGTPAVGATGAGGWGFTGAASAVVGNFDGDPEIVVPDAGGTQEPPEDPDPATPSEMAAAGIYPIRHVWEIMPAPTLVDNRPDNWTATSSGNAEYAYLQIIVEGVDITRYGGKETPFPSWRRAEPFGAQSATIELPQITAFHSAPAWTRHGSNIVIKLIPTTGSALASARTLFNGFVMDRGIREDSGVFTLEALGVLYGADLTIRTPAFTTAPKDIGTLIPQVLNAVPGRRYNAMSRVVTGIKSSVAGGWESVLTGYVQEILGTAMGKGGRQWTVNCDTRTPVLERKNTTTIAATIRTGQRGVTIDLNSDASQAANVIYGEGINSDGGRWRNAKYPNWKPDDTPDYPFTNPINTIYVGVRDSDTDTGNGVSVWQRKVGQPVTGVFSQSDRTALMRLQEDAGITVDGYLGPQSWASTFDTGANTGTLDGAFIAPLASARKVRPRKLGPDGDDLGANPYYDPDIVRVERKINYGSGVAKSRGIEDAKRVLARESSPGWYGIITFELDPSTKSKYELREGDNIRILDWRGGDIDVHVASARYDEQVVTLEVDSQARDYPTLQAIMERDREAVDPAKVAVRRLLQGEVQTDRPTYDAESPAGRMPRHAIFSGLWDVRRIPMGSYGTVVRTEFTTSSSAQPFALAVFGKEVAAADLVSAVGNPLTATDNPWQSDAVDDLGLLQAWGWTSQPAGYYPKTYSDPNGETGNTVTGRLVDDASWEYASASSPWLWVATFAPTACYVEGRFYGGAD